MARGFEIAVMLSLLVLFNRDEVHMKGVSGKWRATKNAEDKEGDEDKRAELTNDI